MLFGEYNRIQNGAIPHPFVIEPPKTWQTRFNRGKTFTFNLLLFGQDPAHFAIYTFITLQKTMCILETAPWETCTDFYQEYTDIAALKNGITLRPRPQSPNRNPSSPLTQAFSDTGNVSGFEWLKKNDIPHVIHGAELSIPGSLLLNPKRT